MKQRKSLYSVSQLPLAKNKLIPNKQIPISNPDPKPTYKIHSESVEQGEVNQYKRGVQMPMPQQSLETDNLRYTEQEEYKQPVTIKRQNIPEPINYNAYPVETSVKQLDNHSNSHQYKEINHELPAQVNKRTVIRKRNKKQAPIKKKLQNNEGESESIWKYQVNPYPVMENCINQNPISQLPPPRYSKQGLLKQQVNLPPNEVIDRKNLCNVAYQLLEHQSKTPSGKMESSPSKKELVSEVNPSPRNSLSNKAEYKPYSLKDYREIRPTKYYKLGGLGANIGSEQWKSRYEKIEKMAQYAKRANSYNRDLVNFKKCPPPGTKIIAPEIKAAIERKEKMKEYARHIPRPPKVLTKSQRTNTKVITEEEGGELSELEKLELQHNEYVLRVQQLQYQL